METVIIAFSGEKSCIRIRDILERAGVASGLVCRCADQVRRMVRQQRVAAVICGYKFSDGTAEELREDLPAACAMLVVAAQDLLDMLQTDALYKLASPITRNRLLEAVEEMLGQCREEQMLIMRAKQQLMERYRMGEEQAHRRLQRVSMDHRIPLAQAARLFLERL